MNGPEQRELAIPNRMMVKPGSNWAPGGWGRLEFLVLGALLLPVGERTRADVQLPSHLPRYQLTMRLDLARRKVKGTLLATWINPHATPTRSLILNAHSRYVVPPDEIGVTAKTLELLRLNPSVALGNGDPALDIHQIALVPQDPQSKVARELPFEYRGKTKTTLAVPLPFAVGKGQSVTISVDFTFHLPNKQGRWGQWKGVTYLTNWLPVFAFYGPPQECPPCKNGKPVSKNGSPAHQSESGVDWQPVPFVAWHQPWFNEAGHYHVRAVLPKDQVVACSGTLTSCTDLGAGWKQVDIQARGVRDFAFLCSARYRVFETTVTPPAGKPVRIHVIAFPEHTHYARKMLKIATDAMINYSRWFGPYPYPDFTIAESYFGWNGNECGSLVMIDERVFGMPHLAGNYVDYLVSHEICHQWWYNLVGTDGYRETWMDEGVVTYFAHRLLNQKYGRNNTMMNYPNGFQWLPNIHREDYRSYGLYGTLGRGENGPIIRPLDKFGHIVNLFSMCYDKGARVVGIIENRLGPGGFLDFMRLIQKRYRYRILRVADFHRELEEYTGKSWKPFFCYWVHGEGLLDWAIDKVKIHKTDELPQADLHHHEGSKGKQRVTVWLRQKGACGLGVPHETELGFDLTNGCFRPNRGHDYCVRIPINPENNVSEVSDPPATVKVLGCRRSHFGTRSDTLIQVDVELPCRPSQIAVDPDQTLVDRNPSNNFWKPEVRWRITPLYTFLEETDLTNSYDRWNLIAGPWIFGTAYSDAWYTRSTMVGLRAGAYRTQQFTGGAYTGYRTDYRDVVVGADALWQHWPGSHWQVGANIERRLTDFYTSDDDALRGVLWARYILLYSSSLYLPPIHFIEGYVSHQDNFFPHPDNRASGAARFDDMSTLGLHYRINYLTPYWDPEGGFQFDAYYEGGVADLPEQEGLHKVSGQVVVMQSVPNLGGSLEAISPTWANRLDSFTRWLADTRLALRLYGATSTPSRGEFFSLGGSGLFRGFDLAERQGSTMWVGSIEWRVPLKRRMKVDAVDHLAGLRNLYAALFYDVGDIYANGKSIGPVAHGIGVGLRADVVWLSFLERTVLRIDVAKALQSNSDLQVWLGVQHPF